MNTHRRKLKRWKPCVFNYKTKVNKPNWPQSTRVVWPEHLFLSPLEGSTLHYYSENSFTPAHLTSQLFVMGTAPLYSHLLDCPRTALESWLAAGWRRRALVKKVALLFRKMATVPPRQLAVFFRRVGPGVKTCLQIRVRTNTQEDCNSYKTFVEKIVQSQWMFIEAFLKSVGCGAWVHVLGFTLCWHACLYAQTGLLITKALQYVWKLRFRMIFVKSGFCCFHFYRSFKQIFQFIF